MTRELDVRLHWINRKKKKAKHYTMKLCIWWMLPLECKKWWMKTSLDIIREWNLWILVEWMANSWWAKCMCVCVDDVAGDKKANVFISSVNSPEEKNCNETKYIIVQKKHDRVKQTNKKWVWPCHLMRKTDKWYQSKSKTINWRTAKQLITNNNNKKYTRFL